MIWLVLYVGCIVAANALITYVGLVPVGFGLLAPAGVYAAGVSFTARDLLQESKGRMWTIGAIVIGAALSGLLSPQLALVKEQERRDGEWINCPACHGRGLVRRGEAPTP